MDRVDLNKVWGDYGSRAVEVLGGEPVRSQRKVKDILRLEFTHDEWRRIFNVDASYTPCGGEEKHEPYKETRPPHIYFIREVTE